MKFLLILIVVSLSPITLSSQNCETFIGQVVNCIDKNGLKQGKWLEFKRDVNLSDTNLTSKDVINEIVSSGSYLNDEKVGVWTFYATDGWTHYETKTIEYLENGFLKVGISKLGFTYLFNSKDSSINGYMDYKNQLINISCKKNICGFYLNSSTTIENLESIKLSNLEYEIDRIKIGAYDKEIKKITTR